MLSSPLFAWMPALAPVVLAAASAGVLPPPAGAGAALPPAAAAGAAGAAAAAPVAAVAGASAAAAAAAAGAAPAATAAAGATSAGTLVAGGRGWMSPAAAAPAASSPAGAVAPTGPAAPLGPPGGVSGSPGGFALIGAAPVAPGPPLAGGLGMRLPLWLSSLSALDLGVRGAGGPRAGGGGVWFRSSLERARMKSSSAFSTWLSSLTSSCGWARYLLLSPSGESSTVPTSSQARMSPMLMPKSPTLTVGSIVLRSSMMAGSELQLASGLIWIRGSSLESTRVPDTTQRAAWLLLSPTWMCRGPSFTSRKGSVPKQTRGMHMESEKIFPISSLSRAAASLPV